MNLDNYKAVSLTVLMKHYIDGTGRKLIELISDDHKAVRECCGAYNQIAELYKCDSIVWTTETIIGYFKEKEK